MQDQFDFGAPAAPVAAVRPTTIDQFVGDYHFLSNFHFADVELDGLVYSTVEHAYQAAKSNDPAVREAVRKAWQPGIAKAMGRRIDVPSSWWTRRVSVMHTLVTRKFQHAHLRAQLDATGRAVLIEGNWWNDTYWGVCRGTGENWLGRILMSVRDGVPLEQVWWRP